MTGSLLSVAMLFTTIALLAACGDQSRDESSSPVATATKTAPGQGERPLPAVPPRFVRALEFPDLALVSVRCKQDRPNVAITALAATTRVQVKAADEVVLRSTLQPDRFARASLGSADAAQVLIRQSTQPRTITLRLGLSFDSEFACSRPSFSGRVARKSHNVSRP